MKGTFVCHACEKAGNFVYFFTRGELDSHRKKKHRALYFAELQRKKEMQKKPITKYEEYYGSVERSERD